MASPLLKIFDNLARDATQPDFWWQFAAVALCVGSAWLAARWLRARFNASREAKAAASPSEAAAQIAEFGAGGFNRLSFPLLAWVATWLGRELLSGWIPVNLFDLALPLLTAFAVVRALVYMLRHVFATSVSVLAAWERWIATLMWLGVALHFTGVLPAVVATMEKLHVTVGKQKITAWVITQGLFSVGITLLVSLWIASAIERRLLGADSLAPNLRVALGRFVKAAMVLVAVLVSLALVGIDLTVLSVFGGAVGVGLGLGLQKIASNYVSGYIILLDQSIRIGDMISVDKYVGSVSTINTRYTVLKALDGTEAIIPNETLLAQPVLNQSLTSKRVRIAVQVSVAYDSDLDAVKGILRGVADAHPRVLKEPEPLVFLVKFGDSGIDLELGFWINDPEGGLLNVKSDLNFALLREFRAQGVEIPYPQREVLLRTSAEAVNAVK